ncbi:hypothetical protein Tco_1552818 [Tanacetum coccineum]
MVEDESFDRAVKRRTRPSRGRLGLHLLIMPNLNLEGRESLAVMVVPSYGARIADGAPLRGVEEKHGEEGKKKKKTT